jgi:hypothetical protein
LNAITTDTQTQARKALSRAAAGACSPQIGTVQMKRTSGRSRSARGVIAHQGGHLFKPSPHPHRTGIQGIFCFFQDMLEHEKTRTRHGKVG